MRVGIDARLRAYRSGGIAEHITRLVSGIRALGWDRHVVVLDHRRAKRSYGGLSSASQASGELEQPAPGMTRRLLTPPHHRLENWTLPVELWPLGLDLLHSPDSVVPRGWRGPSVLTIHDLYFMERPELLTRESARYYGQVTRSVQKARRIITVSQHSARQILEHTQADPDIIRIIPNAVDPRFFEPPTRAALETLLRKHGLKHHGFILFVGTVEPRKNLITLLDAYDAYAGRGGRLELVIAGASGWLDDPVLDKARSDRLRGRVRLLGYVSQSELPALYGSARALAHPALDEGFGMTVAEALACGTPVLASHAGALPEVAGEAAAFLAPEDASAWAAALATLDADSSDTAPEQRRRRVERAERFTIQRMAGATIKVYCEAVEDRPPGARSARDENSGPGVRHRADGARSDGDRSR